jgi:hypothetical protein
MTGGSGMMKKWLKREVMTFVSDQEVMPKHGKRLCQ